MKKALVIDNYDSFTFNLVHYFKELEVQIEVIKNDEKKTEDINANDYAFIVISPGPGNPHNSGISLEIIHQCIKTTPLLGICLGHQCLANAYGATIIEAKHILHGKTSVILHQDDPLFSHIPSRFNATRYHSLAVKKETLPPSFKICASSNDNEIMAIKHRKHCAYGVQFHPEALLTEYGHQLLYNFISLAAKKNAYIT